MNLQTDKILEMDSNNSISDIVALISQTNNLMVQMHSRTNDQKAQTIFEINSKFSNIQDDDKKLMEQLKLKFEDNIKKRLDSIESQLEQIENIEPNFAIGVLSLEKGKIGLIGIASLLVITSYVLRKEKKIA
ncbi:hypothetical protein FQA39_LY05910 [Lamprigera yunnana]|nr:hypothetical protein FQA39_LY05910 [Lamprigera yunnana]